MVTSKILSERAQVCPLSKFTTKADPKTLKEDSETPNLQQAPATVDLKVQSE